MGLLDGLAGKVIASIVSGLIQENEAKTAPKGTEYRATKVFVVKVLGRRADIDIVARLADEPKKKGH
jgi:hypothetical protein